MKKIYIFSLLCLMMAFGLAPQVQAQDNCVITSLPFTEDFENVNSALPACFTRNPLGVGSNGTVYPHVDTYLPHSGSHALRAFLINQPETSSSVYTLVFPELDEQFSMSSMVLEFWAQSYYYNYPHIAVGVMTDPNDLSTFTTVQTLYFATASTYQKFTVYFDQFTGSGRYIALKFANDPAYGQILLDDIVLDQVSVCTPVLNLEVAGMAGADATIHWSPNFMGGTNYYNVTLVEATTGSEITVTTTTDTFYTFTGLANNTSYMAYVTVTCTDNTESPADSVSFSTPGPTVPFPYFQDFEEDTTEILPYFTLWGAGPNQWVYGSAAGMPDPDGTPGDAAHSLYVSVDSGATNTYDYHTGSVSYAEINVIFPENAQEYHLSFDYRVKGRSVSGGMAFDFLSVYMINTEDEMATEWDGAPVGTALLLEAANHPEWTHHDVILENVAGRGKKIIFFWKNYGSSDELGNLNPPAAVDNITLYGVACGQPNNLTATNITAETATLSWSENGSATSWTVFYKPVNSTGAYSEEEVSDTPSIDLAGLLANTNYVFYVVSHCTEAESNPSVSYTFRTGCGPISILPYFEDFETGLYNTLQNQYIVCWDRLSTNSAPYPYIGNYYSYSHSNSHYLDFNYTPNCSNIAIMPALDSTLNAGDLMVTLYACHTYLAYSGTDTLGTLEIGVMTDPTVASTFVVVDTIDLSSLGYLEYEELMISMAAYTGDGKYVAFRSSNSIDCGYLIDDILLELRPDCMYPTNFTLVGVNSESVTVAWEEMGDATSWVVQCDLAGFTPGEGFFSDTVSTTTTTIMGLSNLTAYDIYVQSNCGDSQSEWVGPIPFTSGLYNMGILGEDTLTTCAAIICDDGGLYGDYSTMCDYTLVIYPDAVGNGLQITGTCNLHPGYSGFGTAHLYFFDGAGTNGNLIGDYTGDNANIVVAASGPITVNFVSDYYTASGFILNVECATCTPPSNIHLSDVSTDEATIAWNGIASLYAVTVTGATDLYTTTSDTSYTLIGLSSNSTYSVQVRSLCGTDSSIVYPALTFTTPCDAFTITEGTPWTEDFEGYTGSGNQPFQCWTRTVVDPFYDAPFVYCGHALSCHSGANSAEFKGENGLLALPPFTNDVHDLRLSFWATSTDPSDGILEIGVLTDVMDPNSFEPVAVAGTPGPRDGVGNLMGPFVFDGVAATNGRIALRYSNPYGFDSWNLDDFIVDINPGCEAPTNLTISNITTSEAILNWDSPDLYASEWKLQYKAASATNWGPEIICSATTYYFVNLVPEATYQVRVKTVCDTAAESIWSEIANFTTESVIIIVDTCDVPTGLHTTNVENHTISIAWDANADVSNWNIQYRVLGESAFSSGTANTNSYTISDLVGLTTYEIQVQSNCGDDNLSDWSDFISATTTNVGIGNWLDNSIVLFPNPANKYIDVRIDGDVNVALIEVYDVYGKLISNVNVVENPTRINVSGLANGMYFVRVTTGAGVVTKSFVKN